jgi:carbonic anhydrase
MNNFHRQTQSPININLRNAKSESVSDLQFEYDVPRRPYILHNDAHTVKVVVDAEDDNITLSGGPLGTSVYRLTAIEFHTPSNHLISGHQLDMEITFVHTLREGPRRDDVTPTVMLSILAQAGRSSPLPLLQTIANYAGSVQSVSSWIGLGRLNLSALGVPGVFKGGFVWYTGSLPYPPCTEPVLWIIARNFGTVLQADLEIFRNVPVLVNNTRMPQVR